MKKVFGLAVLTLALLSTISAFGAQKTIKLYSTTQIGGQKLAAGEYRVSYQLKGNTTEVRFLQNKKQVASVSAQLVESAAVPQDDAVVLKSNDDGTSKLIELQFAGEKSIIKFTSKPMQGN